MDRLTVSGSALVALLASIGCGSGASGIDRGAARGGLAGSAGQAAAGGAEAGDGGTAEGGANGGFQGIYSSVDEGVFPKDRVLDVQVAMPAEEWTQLVATARDEIWSSAEVSIDGQSLGDVGFRPKGEYSLWSCVDETGKLVCDKLSFKLKFDRNDPEKRFYGLKRLVLNKVTHGWGLFNETLAYQIYNDFGIIAPRTSYATLTVNGESLGIYRVVEAVDGRFTKMRFPDGDGNLYKEAWPVSTSDDYYASALETNEEDASHDAFIAFSRAMIAANDDALPQTLSEYMDLEKLLDYMAVDYALANWDGITTFYAGSWGQANHNYYMYQAEGAARFTLIPWDLNAVLSIDHWLGDIGPWDELDVECDTPIPTEDGDIGTMPAACDATIRTVALSRTGYHASVQRLLDEVFRLDRLSDAVDEYARQVDPVMRDDPFMAHSEVSSGAEDVKSALASLRERLEAVLAEE